jgi:CelD/BcsL family acetyltransferase involved in cellulose biosynthesis
MLSDRDLDAWRELSEGSVEPNPFFEPGFLLPAATHLEVDGASLLVAERDGTFLACLPVRSARVAGMVRCLRTWCHPYCFLGTPLLHAEAPDEGLDALVRAATVDERAPYLVLESLADDGPMAPVLTRVVERLGLARAEHGRHERAALVRRADPTYLEGINSHHRRELQRSWRRIEEALGAPLEVEERAGDPEAVERFLQLESSGWKGRAGTALSSSPAHAAFFRDVCAVFHRDGRLQLLRLKAGERTVAMKCSLSAGDTLFCFKIAHDEALGRFSPGVQMERVNVDVFHRERPEGFMDSCADPDNQMINRLWPDRRAISTFVISKRGARSAISRRGVGALRVIRGRERGRSFANS